MRFTFILAVALSLAGCSPPAGNASSPSRALLDMEAEFERQVLAIEPQHPGDADGLRDAAIEIAAKVYSKDWSVVRAEAQRSLAQLPEIDLAPYESAAATTLTRDTAGFMRRMAPLLTPGGLAAMRFWDARYAGGSLGPMAVDFSAVDGAATTGMKMGLIPGRTYRGKFKGADVIAARYMRSMVIAPYTITEEGMILPQFDKVTVYAYQAPKA
ncbi:MAG TPA: hypothetical protein VGO52_19065 [Hyphomonadaceae bacterium]|jgi:hypothetical protein|nr:hypothetical protein [Hyphomonadaceae bacterium]